MSGMWIVIEGIDGSGKSTLANNLHRKISEVENKVVLTREPGSQHTPVTSMIRTILKNEHPVPLAELFLFMADRAHHYETVVKPKLAEGYIVIQDRGFVSTVAYQGWGRGMDQGLIYLLNHEILQKRYPEMVILVDTPLEIAYSRIGGRSDDIEAFNAFSFQKLVNDGFHSFAAKSNVPMHVLDGTASPEDLCANAMQVIAGKVY